METFLNKITSRKFLISLAAFLGSFGTGIAGIACGNETIAAVGVVCGVLSGAIYAGCEAYVDGAAASAQTINTNITASTTAKEVVQTALNQESKE